MGDRNPRYKRKSAKARSRKGARSEKGSLGESGFGLGVFALRCGEIGIALGEREWQRWNFYGTNPASPLL